MKLPLTLLWALLLTPQATMCAADTVKQMADEGTVFYIASTGNDAWSGTLSEPNPSHNDGPLATLDAARLKVRTKISEGLSSPVTVLIRGGEYQLNQTVVFGPGDSGTEKCPITYKAYPGEKPVFTGAKRLTEWKPCTQYPEGLPAAAKGKLMKVKVDTPNVSFSYLHLRLVTSDFLISDGIWTVFPENDLAHLILNTAVAKFAEDARRARLRYSNYAELRRTKQIRQNRQPLCLSRHSRRRRRAV